MLSKKEIRFLEKHYSLNIPPVLITEILGDLNKNYKNSESRDRVKEFAQRLDPSSKINIDAKYLIEDNLMGRTIKMQNVPILPAGKIIEGVDGKKGMFCDEQKEWKYIRKWKNGDFSIEDNNFAEMWREITRSVNLEPMVKKYKKIFPMLSNDMQNIETYKDAKNIAIRLTENPTYQLEILQLMMNIFRIDNLIQEKVLKRWKIRGINLLNEFAPYAYYCFLVTLTFFIALSAEIIGTRSTNLVDLHYIFYLPFCMVFTSADNVQSNFAKIFLKDTQDFIEAINLKADINGIIMHWDNMPEHDKKTFANDYGCYPPEFKYSITNKIWKKHMKPRSKPLSSEKKEQIGKKILEDIGPFLDAIKKSR